VTVKKGAKATIKDIAKAVGVAPSTVSRVLSKTSTKIPVTEETRSKILDAVKRMNYSPDINAIRLSRNKSNVLCLVIPTVMEPDGRFGLADHTIVSMMQGVESAIAKTDYRLLLAFKNRKFLDGKEYMRIFSERCADGMIIWGASTTDSYIAELADYPLIQVNSRYPFCEGLNTIEHENEAASFAVTRHLIERGRRRFLYFGARLADSIAIARKAGFLKALESSGLPAPEPSLFELNYQLAPSFSLMDSLLGSGRRDFDAVVCVNDNTARGAILALRKHGLRVPEDVAVTGGDGVDSSSAEFEEITTYKVDCVRLGSLAVESLIDLVEGRLNGPFRKTIPVELLIRRSS